MRKLAVAIIVGWASVSEGQAASFQGLGHLPGATLTSEATAVSDDGRVVVGMSLGASPGPFVWTAEEGMRPAPDVPGARFEWPQDVDRSGLTIVGYADDDSGGLAYRWSAATGAEILTAPYRPYYAFGVSDDGNAVGGYGLNDAGRVEAGMWVGGGAVAWIGVADTAAYDISGDGHVLVGDQHVGQGNAFRWDVENGFKVLAESAGAWAISGDGTTVGGHVTRENRHEAVIWKEDGSQMRLGSLPGARVQSFARALSHDGSIVVGNSDSLWGHGPIFQAFIWDELRGMRNLREVLVQEHGLDLTDWMLVSAEGISDDSRTIVGHGTNPAGRTEAWIAVIPEPGAGLMAAGLVVAMWIRSPRQANSSATGSNSIYLVPEAGST